jgi:MscS family membrane protein
VDESLITVPNGRLADMTVDNRGKRVVRRFKSDLEIPHTTPQWLIDRFILGLRTIINKHPNTQNTSLQVYFSNITPKAITITVNYKYMVLDNKDEFSHRQYIFKNILALSRILKIELAEQPHIIGATEQQKSMDYPSPEEADRQLDTFYDDLDDALNLQ